MNTTTNGGIGRFRPPHSAPTTSQPLDDDTYNAYLAKPRSVPACHWQPFIERLADDDPGQVRMLVLRPDVAVDPAVVARAFDHADDRDLDYVIATGQRLWRSDLVHPERLRRRLRNLGNNAPFLIEPQTDVVPLEQSDWSSGVANLLVRLDDPELLAELVANGHVRAARALPAAAKAQWPLHHLMPADPSSDDVAHMITSLSQGHVVTDADVDYLISQVANAAGKLTDTCVAAAPAAAMPLTDAQRTRMLRTGDRGLVCLATAALRTAPSEEERRLMRKAATAPGGHAVVLAFATALTASSPGTVARGGLTELQWLVGNLSDIEVVDLARETLHHELPLPAITAAAIGCRLIVEPQLLGDWYAEIGSAGREILLERLEEQVGELAHSMGEQASLHELAAMPALPATLAAADEPADWLAALARHVLGPDDARWNAAQQLINDGFRGSFAELAEALSGSE